MQRLWRLLPAPAEPQLGADVYSPLKQLSHRRLESNANVTRILTMNSNTNYGVTLLHNSGLNAVDSLVVASRTIIWSLVKQLRVGVMPLFHGLHRRTALER